MDHNKKIIELLEVNNDLLSKIYNLLLKGQQSSVTPLADISKEVKKLTPYEKRKQKEEQIRLQVKKAMKRGYSKINRKNNN